MQTCIPSRSGVSEIAACPPSPIADCPSALPSAHPSTLPPRLPPAVSNSSCLFTWCQSLYASDCSVLLYFSGYCTVRLKMFSLFFMFVFMYYLCEKYHKPIMVQYCIASCLSWVPWLTLLNLTREMGVSVLHPDISHHHLADPFEISTLNEEGKDQWSNKWKPGFLL